MKTRVLVALAAMLCMEAAGDASAQYSKGPAFAPGIGGHGDEQKLRLKRCFDRHRSPSDRGDSCKRLLDSGEDTNIDAATVARDYTEAGRYDDAQAVLAARLGAAPDDADAQVATAVMDAAQGRYADAAKTADRVVSATHNSAFGFANRCWVRAVAGSDLDAALADCDKAIALEPGESSVWDSRGLVDFKRGDAKTAVADFDKSIALHSYGDYDWNARVLQNDAARDALNDQAGTYYMRGLAKTKAGDADGGARDIATAKAHDPYIDDEYSHYGVKP